ncbi:MAG: RNA methyltransferase [Fibrobacter sp.]|jgi:TrmH family RNA methyltransferase|nr:RNA methyltransferase [Fibrobacter sp.]
MDNQKRTVKFKLDRKFGVSDNSRNLSSGKKKSYSSNAEEKDARSNTRSSAEGKRFSSDRKFSSEKSPRGERSFSKPGFKSGEMKRPFRDKPFQEREGSPDRGPREQRDFRNSDFKKPFRDRPFGDRPPRDREFRSERDSRPERGFGSERPRRREFNRDETPANTRPRRPFDKDRGGDRTRRFESEERPSFIRKRVTAEAPAKEFSEEPVRDEEAILASLDAAPENESEKNFTPPWYKRLLLLTTEKGREREAKFLAEGVRVVQEMLEYHTDILLDIYTVPNFREPALLEKAKEKEIRLHEISEEQMKEISSTVTHQGIIAVCRAASVKPDYEKTFSVLTLVDAIQDPGNLGTLFRTALGFNTAGLILGKGSVNPFNPKVVRGSSGTFLRVPFEVNSDLVERINFLHSKGYTVIATDLHGKQELKDIAPHKLKKVAILVGNEGAGANPSFIDMADEVVRIPMSSTLESLNVSVAHGILSYEIAHLQKELF